MIVVQRQLAGRDGKRDRQAPRRIHVAEQHVGERMAALLAWIPRVEHPVHLVEPMRHRDGAAAHQHDDGRGARRRYRCDQLLLVPRQVERRAVAELPLLYAGHHDGDATLARDGDGAVDRRSPVVHDTGVPHQPQPRIPGALEVLQPQIVGAAGREIDGGDARTVGALHPVVDHERAVEIQPVAVVPLDAEARDAAGRDHERGVPPCGVPVVRDAAGR